MKESESERKPGFGWSMQEAYFAALGYVFSAWRKEPDLSAVDPVLRSEFELAFAAGGA